MGETPLWQLFRDAGEPGASEAVDLLAGRLARIGADPVLEGVATTGERLEMLTLMPLAGRPRLLVRLDERSRGAAWRLTTRSWRDGRWVAETRPDDPWHAVRDLVAAFDSDPASAGPIAVALAATDPDGRRRERAVSAMAGLRRPEHLPFLALRCDDWVPRVRGAAAEALTEALRERPEHQLRVALPMAAHLSGRRRGGMALRIIELLVEDDFARYAPLLLHDRDRRGRRLAFTVGQRQDRWAYADLIRFATREPDPAVRLEAARLVTRAAVDRRDADALRELAGVRFVAVRSLALAGLAELGHDDEVAATLTDPAPLIRAFARSRATRPAERYRMLLSSDQIPPDSPVDVVCGAILGLAEMGDRRDAPLLHPFLRHRAPRLRAAAVRGLVLLDSVPIEETVPLLTDPHRHVVREASIALRTYPRRLPAELPWTLLADPRPEVRLGGFRLLTAHHPIVRLTAALTLAVDPDAVLAHRGRMAAVGLIFVLADRFLEPAPPSGVDREHVAILPALLEQARPRLGRHDARLRAVLTRWPV
ncbi:hypothetical protein Q0Z83_104030 [Actinoplanes sichuanensis]|uniref:HEAT repeat domain-containing protein n=1 Tax=Actinoplanes sichuanensis TaxID=512349 RepID=A0ABW4AHF3_9ACTN|nr:hypothetical protein [Actinoplanes sichuanensis]BEL12212.1 hypothetical protein Q0Z83_104030 [Actinoplanes sichuanensis]